MMPRRRVAPVLTLLLAACAPGTPPCPFGGAPEYASSAGCFTVSGDGLLLVQSLDGRISLPGGSREADESAQCTAFRETWEETGLRLQPRELLQVFDTGFHLYRCERDASSGDIDPPLRFEVRAVFYLPAARFDSYQWRFPQQRSLLENMLLEATDTLSR